MTYVFMIIPQICDKSFYAYQMTNKNRTIQRNLPHKYQKIESFACYQTNNQI